jgi:hypothetical protein
MPHHPGPAAGPVRLSSQLGQQIATFAPQPNLGGLGIVGEGQNAQSGGGYYPQQQSLVSPSITQLIGRPKYRG